MNAQPITETTQTLTVANQYGIDVDWSTIEETLSIDDFRKMVIDPAMSSLAGNIESLMMADFYKYIYNYVGTPATTPASFASILNAGARLTLGLTPKTDRHLLLDPVSMASITNAIGTYFHKASEIEKSFSTGLVGEAAGFKWWETATLPTHTNGTRTDTTPVATIGGTVSVPTGGIVNGSDVITMTAFPDGLTYAQGDVFTVADVYAVNTETKVRYNHLQQFVVLTAETETGSGDMSPQISPTPYASGARQNISIASTGAKAVVNLTGGGSGAASAVYSQPLAYHRNAFTAVFANLSMPYSGKAERATIDGISMRLWRDSDINSDQHSLRIDVLCGWKTIQPQLATRFRG